MNIEMFSCISGSLLIIESRAGSGIRETRCGSDRRMFEQVKARVNEGFRRSS